MYTPEPFKITDQALIEEFIAKNPFATLTSENNGRIEVTHLPINRFSNGKFYGHVSTSNIHATIPTEKEVCFVFNGMHAYISPTYYDSTFNVPTWNYSAVHIYGNIHYIEDNKKTWQLLKEVTKIYEGSKGWILPEEKSFQDLAQYIKFFEIKVISIEAKFKFNQNKSHEDITSVIKSLNENNQPDVANFMKKITKI